MYLSPCSIGAFDKFQQFYITYRVQPDNYVYKGLLVTVVFLY